MLIELGHLRLCTHPKIVRGCVHARVGTFWMIPTFCRSVQLPWWWSGPGPGACQLWRCLEPGWPTAHWSSWPMWGALQWQTPKHILRAMRRLMICSDKSSNLPQSWWWDCNRWAKMPQAHHQHLKLWWGLVGGVSSGDHVLQIRANVWTCPAQA